MAKDIIFQIRIDRSLDKRLDEYCREQRLPKSIGSRNILKLGLQAHRLLMVAEPEKVQTRIGLDEMDDTEIDMLTPEEKRRLVVQLERSLANEVEYRRRISAQAQREQRLEQFKADITRRPTQAQAQNNGSDFRSQVQNNPDGEEVVQDDEEVVL